MEKAGIILDDFYKALNHNYDLLKHHPYHRDWIEIVIKKDYLTREQF